ncbi:Uma2 family endonuclease [Streptomyces sp. NPDC058157]|uniref:Uma2 family endonuclease n=1 Tax=Streptomyces sp. NPDC058157 TaxID=3346360 RepID=UPI0036E18E59
MSLSGPRGDPSGTDQLTKSRPQVCSRTSRHCNCCWSDRGPHAGVPDIVVADAGAIAEDGVSIDTEGVQLIAELVSPGNRTMDRKFKPMLYAEAGIEHYWRLKLTRPSRRGRTIRGPLPLNRPSSERLRGRPPPAPISRRHAHLPDLTGTASPPPSAPRGPAPRKPEAAGQNRPPLGRHA